MTTMVQGTSLKLSCRRGKVLAGYLTLQRRKGDKVARSAKTDTGLVVDYAADGRAVGIEIPNPSQESLQALLSLLDTLGLKDAEKELPPLRAVLPTRAIHQI